MHSNTRKCTSKSQTLVHEYWKNTRPFMHSCIGRFWIALSRSKECKYHIFLQYQCTKNVPVFTFSHSNVTVKPFKTQMTVQEIRIFNWGNNHKNMMNIASLNRWNASVMSFAHHGVCLQKLVPKNRESFAVWNLTDCFCMVHVHCNFRQSINMLSTEDNLTIKNWKKEIKIMQNVLELGKAVAIEECKWFEHWAHTRKVRGPTPTSSPMCWVPVPPYACEWKTKKKTRNCALWKGTS